MNYPGEHLLPGQLGHFFILLSFVASLVATVAYFKSANALLPEQADSWKKMARTAFVIDCISVFSVFGILYFIISTHLFEYFYAWNHSSKSLSVDYLLSCIWEGQEGSFLLWTMWHAVLGLILIFKARKYEAPVMTVISFAQFCLATMIMGIYFFDAKLGSNPFLLVREHFSEAPIFNSPDYLSLAQMQDGQGLNQLLQNYWMVIHPPVLFLGFASTIVPFAYAIAGLWKKDYTGWTKAALPWALFSAAILGTGIMMGAAWAYESLTFGGYWAWDPVENASLVPWLVLLAGLHTHVVYNATGHSLRITYLLYILGFVLILYSTYLTRSGALQDTSVHAFSAEGMKLQLELFFGIFTIPALILFFRRFKQIPHINKEESSYSREFWMFIGALVLFLSSIFIIVSTSLPVINKLLGTKFAMGEDVEFAYNRVQIFVAIVLGVLTAVTQYLKYKDTTRKFFLSKIAVPSIVSLALGLIIVFTGGIHYEKYGPGFLGALYFGMFAAIYATVANAGYIWFGLKGKLKAAGGSVAHIGFGLMLVGILVSSSNKKVLSYNTTGINLAFDPKSKEKPLENITLIKGMKTDMGKYWATYVDNDSSGAKGNMMYFKIRFDAKDSSESFELHPNLIKATKGQQGFSNNPDKRHYLNRDIFSYISYADDMDRRSDTATYRTHAVNLKDTVFYSNGFAILDSVIVNPSNGKYSFAPTDTALMAHLTVFSKDGQRYRSQPVYYVKDNRAEYIADTVFAQNLAFVFSRITNDKKIELQVKESEKMVPFVALKVYEFPYINVLWAGIIIMMTGFGMSIVYRARRNRISEA